MTSLSMHKVTVSYGSLLALDSVSLEIDPHRVTSIVGPNGAGKSTLLGVASGFLAPRSGRLELGGVELGAAPYDFAAAGVRRTFQTPRVMPAARVLENVLVGTHLNVRSSFLADVLDTTRRFMTERDQTRAAMEALEMVGLADSADSFAGSLPYGQVRLLELARAVAGKPRLLLLDEPAAGLNDEETQALGDLLRRLSAEEGVGVVLVEHNLQLVTSISDVIHVLNFGQLIATGDPETVINNPAVIEAYTGRPK